MIYVQLFLSFLQVGMFSVGGGYAAIPLIQSQVVEQHGWLTMQEFTDLVTIAEMTPGPIAVNAATFVGLRIAQVSGAIVATLGCITPALIFVSLLACIYKKYKDISLLQNVLACLRPAVVAMIASAGVSILTTAFWENADKITFLNVIEGQQFADGTGLEESETEINVQAYAIQTTDLTSNDVTTPSAVWQVLANQNQLS